MVLFSFSHAWNALSCGSSCNINTIVLVVGLSCIKECKPLGSISLLSCRMQAMQLFHQRIAYVWARKLYGLFLLQLCLEGFVIQLILCI